MKQYFRSLVLTGFVTSLLSTLPSQAMDLSALLGGGQGGRDEGSVALSSSLMTIYTVGENETIRALFEEGISWYKLYRTHDGKDLKLSFSYNPCQANNESMPKMQIVEEEYKNVFYHFVEEFSHHVAPEVKTHVEEKKDGLDKKLEFLGMLPASKEWSQTAMKLPGFSPQELYSAFLSEAEEEDAWKKNLYAMLNSEKINSTHAFTIEYQVPANPGLLKRYEGVQSGEIKFGLPVENKGTVGSKAKAPSVKYTRDLNYGVFTLSLKKEDPEGSIKPAAMPHDLDALMNSFYGSMNNLLETQKFYASISYGNPRDNSHGMMG